jgi:hypothetical protein
MFGLLPTLWDVTILVNLRYHPSMSNGSTSRVFGEAPEDETVLDEASEAEASEAESTLLRTVGWISAGLGAVALGLFVGREIRQRYKFNRRTPYDFYAHSGDEQDVDFGLGI